MPATNPRTIPANRPALDRGRSRRAVLAGGAALLTATAGCSGLPWPSPSSGGPPYETHEIDDGPVYGPGLQDGTETARYAGLVTDATGLEAFDRQRLAAADRAFLDATDFADQYLAVVQVAGVSSSMAFGVPDVSEGRDTLVVVASLDDRTPATDDRVVTTLLVRVTPRRGVPDAVRVELHVNDEHATVTGR
jgi:hypothetical protein